MDARKLCLSSIQKYVEENKRDIEEKHSRCKLFVDRVKESGRDCNWLQTYEKEERDLRDNLQWIEFMLSIREPIHVKPISPCLYPESVRYIEEKISSFTGTHRGTKDELKIFMIMNAPYDVGLTLLDHLFLSSSNHVCKLHVDLLMFHKEELETKSTTLASIYHHWVMGLVTNQTSENLVLMDALDPMDSMEDTSLFHHTDDPTRLFHCMIPTNTNLLLCLSNINVITEGCLWAKDVHELKSFWMSLYSFTRACSPWIHIIATSSFLKQDNHYGITMYASDMTYHHVNLLHIKK